MKNNLRIFIGTFAAAALLTIPLILLACDGILITAYIFSLAGLFTIAGTLLHISNRQGGEYVVSSAFPLASVKYFILQLLLSMIILLLSLFNVVKLPLGWFIFLQTLLAVFFIWKLLAMDSGKEYIEAVGTKVKIRISRWKDFALRVSTLLPIADQEVKKDISAVYDALRYADPMSDERLNDIENAIDKKIIQLSDKVKCKNNQETVDLCQQLLTDIKIRNEQCKAYK